MLLRMDITQECAHCSDTENAASCDNDKETHIVSVCTGSDYSSYDWENRPDFANCLVSSMCPDVCLCILLNTSTMQYMLYQHSHQRGHHIQSWETTEGQEAGISEQTVYP